MAIKFKVIEKGEPGVVGGGSKRFYASANLNGEKTLAGLTRDMEKRIAISNADIRSVLYALMDEITRSLAEGEAVRLGDFGSLRVNISSDGKATEQEVTAASIRAAKVIFTPGTRFKNMLSALKYEKKNTDD